MKRGGLCSDLHLVIETSRFILPQAGTPMECEVPDNMAGVVIIAIIIINIIMIITIINNINIIIIIMILKWN